jgi:hypothetical protein
LGNRDRTTRGEQDIHQSPPLGREALHVPRQLDGNRLMDGGIENHS